MNTPDDPTIAAAAEVAARSRKRLRRRAFTGIFAVVLLAGVAYATYWIVYGRSHVSTDDAYVGGNIVQVTPQVEGTVVAVKADDTRLVREGDILVQLDAADAEVKLASAEAALADAVRSVRGLYASISPALVRARNKTFIRPGACLHAPGSGRRRAVGHSHQQP
jgi:membrane fusion protein (multidrug efflux system)